MQEERRTPIIMIVFDRILIAGAALAGVLVFCMMLSVCYDVVVRYFFNAPTIWADEISSIFLLFTPFFAGAWILKNDGHVKMDLVLNYLGPRPRLWLGIFASIIIALVCLAFVIYGVKTTWGMYEMGYRTDTTLRMAKWPILAVIPLGFFLLLVQAVRNIVTNYLKLHTPESES